MCLDAKAQFEAWLSALSPRDDKSRRLEQSAGTMFCIGHWRDKPECRQPRSGYKSWAARMGADPRTEHVLQQGRECFENGLH